MSDKKKDMSAAVRRMAQLAKMGADPAEVERFVEKAGAVIEYFEQLGEVDTEGVEPTAHAVSISTELRGDVVDPFGAAEEILAAAPASDGPYVQVPKVIEGE